MIVFLPKFMMKVKHLNFEVEIVIFPFLDGDSPRSTSYEVYLSSSDLPELLAMLLISTLAINYQPRIFLNKAISIKKFAKLFFKFYRLYYDLIPKFHGGLLALIIFQRSLLK